jgi:oligopeptide/dipeptide ABC transporter ATP-binding protein
VKELLELVALDASLSTRYPHQLSGGQQQRVNIARAIATDPKVLILDEPTSSLDVSVRVGVLQLLLALQKRLNLTYLLISHDLPTVRRVADAVAVMYLGRIVEIGPVETILTDPKHPYTEYLLASELTVNPEDQLPEFAVREATYVGRPKVGCVFATRCPIAEAACETDAQTLQEVAPGHEAACMVRTRNNA